MLRKEIIKAKTEKSSATTKLNEARNELKTVLPLKCRASVILHTRYDLRLLADKLMTNFDSKLTKLSREQDKPLFNVHNTVICYQLDSTPPKYVIETLSLGPKNSTLEKFNQNDILSELDSLVSFCKKNKVDNNIITDINVKTLAYIKKCKKQRSPRHVQLTKQYLKQNKLLAIPFDKGIGICIVKIETYNEKLRAILDLPQFEKVAKQRKNEKNPILKEEERVVEFLKNLLENGKLSSELFKDLKPIGSQPARLYGLIKVHKNDFPARPVLSMPGSAYYKIAKQTAEWLSVVPECCINTSSKDIANQLNDIVLREDYELVSFDVVSLYTNVPPLLKAIDVCADLVYSGKYKEPPVDKETFIELLKICNENVMTLTHDGLYRQTDGLAMGSPPAPMLANGWLSSYDSEIKGDAMLYERYMDDILRDIHIDLIDSTLTKINNDLNEPSLKFTVEREKDNKIAFLDMEIHRKGAHLESTWYTKPTDTGLVMNFLALAPIKYKRSVICGMVHRIFRSCSNFINFHESLCRAKEILEKNQYPKNFVDSVIKDTLDKLVGKSDDEEAKKATVDDEVEEFSLKIQYRGKISDEFKKSLTKIKAPCRVIFTLKKLKTVLPSLKPSIEIPLKSWLVYKIQCPRCNACYVGYTCRHLISRVREHGQSKKPVGKHMARCNHILEIEDASILAQSSRSEYHLLILEALFIAQLKPSINTRDEFKSHKLIINLFSLTTCSFRCGILISCIHVY